MKVKNTTDKELNPFELHINKKKFNILGRKTKNEVGKPGIARSKAIQKRKKSLLLEYKLKDKSNKFVDRRIGENNHGMTAEDRVIARFTANRIKAQKKMKYNLGEEEDLTHQGQALSSIEKFEKPISDDDEDSDDDRNGGRLGADFVEKAHFGGGVLSKAGDGESSHRNLIDKLIAESKLRKYEKKQLKQETTELTEQLDKDWKELMPVVPTKNRGELDYEDEPLAKKKVDKNSYDVLMRSLKFDARGMASDKLKSDEVIAKEEKERLEKLEAERIKRMKGVEDNEVVKHRSADDLDDGFDFGDDDVQPLAYNAEGKPLNCGDLVPVNNDEIEEDKNSDDASDKEINERSDEDDDINEGEDLSDNDDETNLNEDSMTDDDEECNLDHDMSDLKDDDEKNLDDENVNINKKKKQNSNQFVLKLKEKKVTMEEARKQLPFTFTIPDEYECFQEIVDGKSITDQNIIIERMIKVNHPSLGNNNRSNLMRLFTFLLQHINDTSSSLEGWKILNLLVPHFYDLTQFFPEYAAKCFVEILKEKHSEFVGLNLKIINPEMLLFLKLVPLLFPTSDYYHPVCTYAVLIACELLCLSVVKTRANISSLLLLCTILLEYVQLSKRFIPEVINVLRGILGIAVKEEIPVGFVQQFKPSMKMLVIDSKDIPTDWPRRLSINEIYNESNFDTVFKLSSLYITLELVSRFSQLCNNIQSSREIWFPHLQIINEIKIESDILKNQIEKVKKELQIIINKKLEKLQTLSNRPKALRLYEPRIQKVFDGRTFKTQSKEKAERTKLLKSYKREMKSAVREIRKDNSFLSKLKYHEQVKNDVERRNKVKQIYSWGASQAHEINKLTKKKNK
ncbi:nucleolar protein 14 [Daktulosphaira vitifoliae]|uniref:nucleolar protein 14 n=1 Tax=Daktulosphaira vitifoliae TaxID=58002 RepID=UPI0021A9C347|nr:nucleolar protein 14 [Daktulosphaira vitifoliae]